MTGCSSSADDRCMRKYFVNHNPLGLKKVGVPMYHKQSYKKPSRSNRSTQLGSNITSSPSHAPLSSVVQRAQQDPNKVSGDEWEQLNGAIGTNATGEVLTGEQWVPEFTGISGQLWGGAAIQMKSIDDNKYSQVEQENKTGLPEKLKAGIIMAKVKRWLHKETVSIIIG